MVNSTRTEAHRNRLEETFNSDSKKSHFDDEPNARSKREDDESPELDDEFEDHKKEPNKPKAKPSKGSKKKQAAKPRKTVVESFLNTLKIFIKTTFAYYPNHAWENVKRIFWFIVKYVKSYIEDWLTPKG